MQNWTKMCVPGCSHVDCNFVPPIITWYEHFERAVPCKYTMAPPERGQ